MGVNRRSFLAGTGLIGASALLSSQPAQASAPTPGPTPASAPVPAPESATLKFNSDGRFTVVQFNDTQDNHLTDKRTIDFMGRVLDQEKPGFALINGDVITSGEENNEQVYQAINNVVMPMESRGIPWAVTFGNHDEDSTEENGTSVFEPQMVDFIRQYKFNHNAPNSELYGDSNTQLSIAGSASDDPAFALWLLDSNNYIKPKELAGQSLEELPGYDYLHTDQIRWYQDTSKALEQQFGRKIPGLMFFHIPTYEHRDMWFGGPYKTSKADHRKAVERHGIVGVKHEDVYVGAFNSGIYSAVRERGDVLGIYCGHDHINTYNGNYFGVELGYCPGTGFAPYGLHDGTWDQHTLRGARIFELNENNERVYESTRLVFAKDLGLDMNPKKQPLDAPTPIPEYVSYER